MGTRGKNFVLIGACLASVLAGMAVVAPGGELAERGQPMEPSAARALGFPVTGSSERVLVEVPATPGNPRTLDAR